MLSISSPTGIKAQSPDSREIEAKYRFGGWVIFAALVIFIAINAVAAATKFAKLPPTEFPEMTWTGWAVHDFLQSPKSADVVFVGSSLMLVPIAGADADYLQKKLDGSQHHQSLYFENAFKKRTGYGISTFNFALPGQMPSDAYLIMHNLLKNPHKPKVVVYGLGPRDFIDNCLPSPAATDPYRSLSRFGGVEDKIAQFMPDIADQFNFQLERLFYLYGNKLDLSKQFMNIVSVGINKLIPLPVGTKPYSIFKRHELIPEYKAAELTQGEAFFRPTTAADRKVFFDNLAEYKKRYKTVKWATFKSQLQFLSQLLKDAHSRGIYVVLMSMPITDLNRSLLRQNAYAIYKQSVRTLAQENGASYIDLEKNGQFNINDFGDTVHLHARGGMKMLDTLCEQLVQDAAVTSALNIQINPQHLTTASKQGGSR